MANAKPPVLQVLFEPFPDAEDYTWDREGGEAFAGNYWLDALDESGALRDRGYRAMVEGCSGCRRSDDDPRAHWDMRNDNPGARAPKKPRHCGKWRMIKSIVKAFGGWKRVHYVELAEYEGLRWQPIPQRLRVPCRDCDRGSVLVKHDDFDERVRDGREMFHRVTCTACRGASLLPYEGPIQPDRFALADYQRRMRTSEMV